METVRDALELADCQPGTLPPGVEYREGTIDGALTSIPTG